MFVLPMLGHSSRFFEAGYTIPKYKLPLGKPGEIVFDHVLNSFKGYFESDLFVLICRSDFNDKFFLQQRLIDMGVKNYEIIEHAFNTNGQAESVELGLSVASPNEELYIFNIDTILYKFEKKKFKGNRKQSYLEVFEGEGNHWSFVEPKNNEEKIAKRVTEKIRVSNLCSNGLYFFSSCELFQNCLDTFRCQQTPECHEIFVAPLYNLLIKQGSDVAYELVEKSAIGFCGVPDEYELLKKFYSLNLNNTPTFSSSMS